MDFDEKEEIRNNTVLNAREYTPKSRIQKQETSNWFKTPTTQEL